MEHSPGSSPDDLPPRSAPQGQGGEDVPAMAPPAASREGADAPHEPDRPTTAGSTDSSGTGRKSFVVFGWIFVSLGIIVLAARILFVRVGVLYGTSPVSQVNAIAGASIVIGFALIASRNAGKTRGRRNRNLKNEVEGDGSAGQGWAGWASGATALVAAGALVVSLMNLVEPLNPPNLAMPACPGARDANVKYVGIATGVNGVDGRQGPGTLLFAQRALPSGMLDRILRLLSRRCNRGG